MIRLLLSLAVLFIGAAHANPSLEGMLIKELRNAALLPDNAEIAIQQMTPVRGSVARVTVTSFQPDTGSFKAIIANGLAEAAIKGRARVSIPVVVARTTLRRDHVIEATDLEVRQVYMANVPATAYALKDDVIGKSVRRSLVSGRPIKQDDVGFEIVIKKNASIEIAYDRPGMALSMRGRSLEAGAIGDMIRVTSDGQGSAVVGEVVSPDRVVVR
ncbi:MAG: flagellar basal body P-ring formation protein FlgA [Parvularculaceae bacterium]|nr:flagellar basal body P-ring formation protein FlgA [Parvularculaceae bacterium]